MRIRLNLRRSSTLAMIGLAIVWTPKVLRATEVETPFDGVPRTHERIREEAQAAPLAMRFEGTTPEEPADWQERFGTQLKSLLGPHRPPQTWKTVYRAAGAADQFHVDRFEGGHNFHGKVAHPLFDKVLHPGE